MVCRERSDYYEPLPDSDLENGEEKELAREQAAQEAKYERMLMDVYNALYKVHRLAFPVIKTPARGCRRLFCQEPRACSRSTCPSDQ